MWESELETARKAAGVSGKILNKMFGKVINIEKKGKIDLVTEADFQSEKAIADIIKDGYPWDSLLTEETGEHGLNSGERLWIIDPLDGTTNFAHSFPFFAVSIALQVRGEVVLGVVYNPYLNELFEARKGDGASLNGKAVKASDVKELEDSLVATGFPYSIHDDSESVIDLLKKMIVLVQGIRRPGAAAIDLCYVASGKLDGFWEEGLQPWDTAAGSLIVMEAGGKVSDFFGADYIPFQKNIVAANRYIHPKMLNVLGS